MLNKKQIQQCDTFECVILELSVVSLCLAHNFLEMFLLEIPDNHFAN